MTSIKRDLIIGAILTSVSFGIGYGYGAMFSVNKNLAAKAFAISSLCSSIFTMITIHFIAHPIYKMRTYNAINLTGQFVLGIFQIIAFNKLNLISTKGTIFFSVMLIPMVAMQHAIWLDDYRLIKD